VTKVHACRGQRAAVVNNLYAMRFTPASNSRPNLHKISSASSAQELSKAAGAKLQTEKWVC